MDPWDIFSEMCRQVVERQRIEGPLSVEAVVHVAVRIDFAE